MQISNISHFPIYSSNFQGCFAILFRNVSVFICLQNYSFYIFVGIGKATAFNLAQRNARVLMACRNLEKAEKVKSEIISASGNTNIEIKHLELESFSSVRKCAEDVIKTEKRLDVLINNAGVARKYGANYRT